MTSIRALATAFLLTGVLALSAACGDDGGGAKGTPTVAGPATSPAGTNGDVTPFPTPLVSGNQITSPNKGYSATMPANWKFRPNLIQTADASADVLFEPLIPGAQMQANISLNCVVIKAASEDSRVQFQKTLTARQGLNKDIVVSARKISGIDATVLSYRNESQQDKTLVLDKQDILFTSPKCDWILTTTTLVGERDKYTATFEAFINSFKVQ
jgi:hypothetical protein